MERFRLCVNTEEAQNSVQIFSISSYPFVEILVVVFELVKFAH